jgi:hypothetical protein
MALDRANRDAVALVLADFLRGQVPARALDGRLQALPVDMSEPDPDDDQALHVLLLDWFALTGGGKTLGRPEWEHLRRHLALLRSDLEPALPVSAEGNDLALLSRLARRHLLGLLLSAGLSLLLGWWLLLAGWVAVTPLFFVMLWLHSRRRPPAPAPARFAPFADEGQWQAHQHLLQGLDLPAFDPAVHTVSLDLRPAWARRRAGRLLLLSLGVLMFALALALALVVWPLVLAVMALQNPHFDPNNPNSLARR